MHGTIGSGLMQIMDPSGHLEIRWNPADQTEVRNARTMFEDMIGQKGYRAFLIEGDNQQGKRITTFDPNAAKIMMMPHLVGG